MKNKGQTLVEFILIFTVLLLATSGVLAIYKKFWKSKYQRVSAPSGALTGSLNFSDSKANYVK